MHKRNRLFITFALAYALLWLSLLLFALRLWPVLWPRHRGEDATLPIHPQA